MRESCLECVCKHLGQAAVLLHEAKKGYDYHLIYAMGHLAEAEDESAARFPEIKWRIYTLRKAIQRGESINIDELVRDVYERWQDEMQ